MKRLMSYLGRPAAVLAVALAMAGFVLGPTAVLAQPYPVNSPTYLPNPTLPAATIPTGTTSTFPFFVNGVGTPYVRIAGSPSGLSATMQCTEARTGTPAWTSMSVDTVGGSRISTITAAGLYRLNVAGCAQARLSVAALTSGATTVSFSAGNGEQYASTLPVTKATYSAAAIIGTGATTHFLSIAGSATKTIAITRAECSGKATAALAVNITAEVDSTADTGDAGTAVTGTPMDSSDAAATAVVLSHTTSPTPGSLVGDVRAGTMTLVVAATPITPANVLAWSFGDRPGAQQVILRGVAQSFSLNTSAAFGSGGAVGCALEWTEE